MNNYLENFPDKQVLKSMYLNVQVQDVNAHLHTPFSFSAFDNIAQIFSMSAADNIKAVGVNDFYVTDGYNEFSLEAQKSRIFPLFNIEFIGLMKKEQSLNVRINDPSNPGRCYMSGKGLDYPFRISEENAIKMKAMIAESQNQVMAMAEKVNQWAGHTGVPLKLEFEKMKSDYARELVRERHIAKAIRIELYKQAENDAEGIKALFGKFFGGKDLQSSPDDIPAVENEIRAKILKAGGSAFVEENESAFLPIDEVINIIKDAGGIPCYPLLLDDKKGNYTEFEQDPAKLHNDLSERGIRCIEFIPGRNDESHLVRYVKYFEEKDYIILFGTEHNTPEMIPVKCTTRSGNELTPYLRKVSWDSTCVVAAHQYLRVKGESGYKYGDARKDFIELGSAVINHWNMGI